MAASFWAGLGKVLDLGAAYMQHVQFAQQALATPSSQADDLLRQYTQSLSEASFTGLKMTLTMLVNQERDATRQQRLQHLLDIADSSRQGRVAVNIAAPAVSDFDADLTLAAGWLDNLTETDRPRALVVHVQGLTPSGYESFIANARRMAANCERNMRNHEANESKAWGGCIEDSISYSLASLRTGQRDPAFIRKLRTYEASLAHFRWVVTASEQAWSARR
jgi:hypothetical protein